MVLEATRAEGVPPSCQNGSGRGRDGVWAPSSGDAMLVARCEAGPVAAARGRRASDGMRLVGRATSAAVRGGREHQRLRDCSRGSEHIPSHRRGSTVVVLLVTVVPRQRTRRSARPAKWIQAT